MPEIEALTTAHVRDAIRSHGLEIQVIAFDGSTATAPLAAQAIGTSLGSIVKSLCFVVGDLTVVVLTAGDQRVDDRKLGALYGVGRKKVKIAEAHRTVEATGYEPGGVPPVGHRTAVPILIDATLGRFETVYAAAGSANTIFPIPFETLVRITGGGIVNVVKDAEDVSGVPG